MATRTRRKTTRKKGLKAPLWQSPWLWIGISGLVLLAALWWVMQPGDEELAEIGLESILRNMAGQHRVEGDALEIDNEIRKTDGVFVRSWKLRFPDSASREEFIAEIVILGDHEAVTVAEPVTNVGRMIGLRIDHGVEAFDLELSVARTDQVYSEPEVVAAPTRPAPTATPRPAPPPGARGQLAILLDDAGQKIDLVASAARLPDQIGIAVLPFLPSSTESAVAFYEAGHEVWLHLPMEAVGGADPGPGALMVGMSDADLHDAVFMAINNIPHVVGVNNHMGSRATADLRMMTWVMQDLAAMDLAFLDSRTTVETVAEDAARAQGVRAGRRHVFLDNERNASAIRAQLEEAVYRSRTEGKIVAIGHLNDVTIGVLADELPGLEKRGVTLVRVTEILE